MKSNNQAPSTASIKPLPFYFKDWFIVLLSVFWPAYGVPLLLAVVLVIIRNNKNKLIPMELYNEYLDFENVRAKLEFEKYQKGTELDELNKDFEELNQNINNDINKLDQIIKDLQQERDDIRKEIDNYEKEFTYAVADTRDYEGITSEQLKNEISMLGLEEKELIKDNKALIISSNDTKKNINSQSKQILRCFSAETENILSKITVANIDTSRNRVVKTFETLNSIFSVDKIELSKQMLEIKLKELNLIYQYHLILELEREQQRAIKEQMAEEAKIAKEIEREKAKINKEERQFKNEVSKLISYLQKTDNDIEKNLYLDKIKELEDKLQLLEKDKENVLNREQNTRAGFVYIISNIGSFGENVYKIGMTRRLEPMDRIKELGSASVPFEFDVHAMIFSEDAPTLETALHQHFRRQEINKVNSRKEFFKVDLHEIETVVKENHNSTVEFTLVAKAEQYRESIRLAKQESQGA